MTGPTWQCSDCDTFNGAGARVCTVCDTPRGASEPPPGRKPTAAKKTTTPKKKTTAAPKKPPPAKKTAPAKKAPATGTPAAGTVVGTPLPRLHAPGLEWMCPVCHRHVVEEIRCDTCGTLWSRATTTTRSPVHGGAPRAPGTVRPTAPEPTRGEIATACGCLLFLAAAVVTLIVLLIVNWSSVTSFVTGSDSSEPSPAPSWGGPCPKQLTEMIPEGAGATLVAAYSREDLEERYAFCRARSGKTYYFFKPKNGEPYGNPTEVKRSEGAYVVDFFPQKTSYRFGDGELKAYDEDGKEVWNGDLVPEATVE